MWASLLASGVIEKSKVNEDWYDLVLYRLFYRQAAQETAEKAWKDFKKREIAAGRMVDHGDGTVSLVDPEEPRK